MYYLAKTAPLIVVAAAIIATEAELQSAGVGVALAALGGGLAQMRRSDNKAVRLTLGQFVAEIGLSGIAGFITFAAIHSKTEDMFLVWSSCIASGLVGSAGLNYIINKVKANDEPTKKDK